ncbi:MAG: S8 family serine peptidase [Promethearchaeota archaeon]
MFGLPLAIAIVVATLCVTPHWFDFGFVVNAQPQLQSQLQSQSHRAPSPSLFHHELVFQHHDEISSLKRRNLNQDEISQDYLWVLKITERYWKTKPKPFLFVSHVGPELIMVFTTFEKIAHQKVVTRYAKIETHHKYDPLDLVPKVNITEKNIQNYQFGVVIRSVDATKYRTKLLRVLPFESTCVLDQQSDTRNVLVCDQVVHPSQLLKDLASFPFVVGLAPLPIYKPFDVQGIRDILVSGDPFVLPGAYPGNEITLMITDTGLDVSHCSFYDPAHSVLQTTLSNDQSFTSLPPSQHSKIRAYLRISRFGYTDFTDYEDGHGTHVAGTAVGFGSCGSTNVGVAPNSKVLFVDLTYGESQFVMLPADLSKMFLTAYKADVTIHTASWGNPSNPGLYDDMASQFDDFSYDYPTFITFTSAGNLGDEIGDQSITSPASAKNIISVGATYSRFYVQDFSSRGNTLDGRIAPLCVVPGTFVVSARADFPQTSNGHTDTSIKSGTSMASPGAAGLGARLSEMFFVQQGGHKPTNALMRATLISFWSFLPHKDGSSIQDYQGFGIPTFSQSFWDGDYEWTYYENQTIAAHQQIVYHLVATETKTYTFGLAWTDLPGTPGTPIILINNLNLRVVLESGQLHGNGIQNDAVNNEERVTVYLEAGTNVDVYVNSHTLNSLTQNFALVVNGGVSTGTEGPTFPPTPLPTPSPTEPPTPFPTHPNNLSGASTLEISFRVKVIVFVLVWYRGDVF